MPKKVSKKGKGKEISHLPAISEEIREEKTETEEFDKDGIVTKRTKCEVYARVVGYIRPVHQWNDGKRAEFDERKEFNINPKK